MQSDQSPKVYLYRQIVHAKLFIDNHYADDIDLDNIAEEAFFSKFHFIRLFKKIYGKTPHQYLTIVRIENAKRLLKSGASIGDACYAVGFESLGSFSSLFKKTIGVTPSFYADLQLQLREKIRMSPLDFIPGCFAEKNGWTKKSNFE